LNVCADRYAKKFSNILDAFDLKQHVKGITHKDGHTLDLVITRSDDDIIKVISVRNPMISDHHAIHCELDLCKPQFAKKVVNFRKLRSVDIDQLSEDLLNSELFQNQQVNINNLVIKYDNTLKALLDKHAPLKAKLVTIRPKAAWYTPEISEEKRKRRRLERKWVSTGLSTDRANYAYQCGVVNNLIDSLKTSYY
ncbi:predicted protein, partial [Nematostella vectensis]